ncbi:MAG: hypothetical protein ABS81_07245 [Pseudonocardia sp. SCN 72-86]|nr:MAG: hypothetical protein ABS81_07245 [Pseudonocardia sp. SCN 72-86]
MIVASIRAVAVGAQEGSNNTVSKPTGTASGDLLVAICANDETPGQFSSAPSGFSEIGRTTEVTDRPKFIAFSKPAGGSEPSTYQFGVGTFMSNLVWLYAVQDLPANYSLFMSAGVGSSNACAAPSIVTGTHGGIDPLVMTAHAAITEYTTRTFSTPSGMTARGGALNALWMMGAGFSIGLSGSVDTGSRSSTISASEPWRSLSLALVETPAAYKSRLFLPF